MDECVRYCSEILAIVFQTASASQIKSAIEQSSGMIESVTEVLGRYVEKDPKSEPEKEFAANLINILSSILLFHSDAQVLFEKADGINISLNLIRYVFFILVSRFKRN
jgi:hypothetical protein